MNQQFEDLLNEISKNWFDYKWFIYFYLLFVWIFCYLHVQNDDAKVSSSIVWLFLYKSSMIYDM